MFYYKQHIFKIVKKYNLFLMLKQRQRSTTKPKTEQERTKTDCPLRYTKF